MTRIRFAPDARALIVEALAALPAVAQSQLWIKQLGSHEDDSAWSVASDGAGGVLLRGATSAGLNGRTACLSDAWIARYDRATGNQLWLWRLGTSGDGFAYAVAADGSGGAHFAGATEGSLGGPSLGGADAELARYDGSVPASYCTASTTTNGCSASISAATQPNVTFTSTCALSVAGVEGQRQRLIFYGVDNTGFSPLPWSPGSSSFLCVKPPTQRTAIQDSGGAIASCSGMLSLDWNAFHAANPGALGTPFTAGSKVYAQGWFRDPPAPVSTNPSNALELTAFP